MAEKIDWYAALGAKKPETPTETAPAETETPAEEATTPKASSESPAERVPDDEGAAGREAEDFAQEGETGAVSPVSDAMSKEQRAENARRRREQESRELEERIRTEERTRSEETLKSFITDMGLTDDAGNPVTTVEQYQAFVKARDKQLIDEELGRLGMDGRVIDTMINNHPAIQEARIAAEAARQAQQRGLDAAAEARAQEQLAEITKLDPAVKTLEDLQGHESYGRVYSFVKGGLSMADAFKAANLDAIRERDRAAAAQQAINSAQSKGHMTPKDGGGGALQEPIPEEIRRSYRNMYGNISDEEIRKKYERIQKTKG